MTGHDRATRPGLALAEIGNQLPADQEVTHVIFILDRSGSMSDKVKDVLGGVNSLIAELKKEPGACGVSYVRFDTEVELVWNDLPLKRVPGLTKAEYVPRGGTALLDAVGMTLGAINSIPTHRYIVNVFTDGEENSSREWTNEKVRALIADKENEGNWTFGFFGCGIEMWAQVQDWGMSRASAAAYSAKGSAGMMYSTARVANVMRSRRMRSSASYGETVAAAAANPDMTEEEIEERLKQTQTGEQDASS